MIDAVLPLRAYDWRRFDHVLRPSLEKHLAPLGTCWVIMKGKEAPQYRQHFEGSRFTLVLQEDLAAFTRDEWERIRLVGKRVGTGRSWFVQQILKLAAASLVRTPFYLVLDADLVCTRPVSYGDLVVDGRGVAPVRYGPRKEYDAWSAWTEAAFGFRPFPGRTHRVTPAVLSVEGVSLLAKAVCGESSDGSGDESPHGRLQELHERFVARLGERLPWTEYTLYYSFLETTGLFDRLHAETTKGLEGNSVWHRHELEGWAPEKSFDPEAPFCFSVIQSNSVPAAELLDFMRPYAALFSARPEEFPQEASADEREGRLRPRLSGAYNQRLHI